MSAFRVLIADRDKTARAELRRLIGPDSVTECPDGPATLESIERMRPDVAIVDAALCCPDAFAFARDARGRFPIILTSTAPADAVRAFEARVFDFLPKPFNPARVTDSVGRARTWATARRSPQRIAVPRKDRGVLFLRVAEIDWIEGADNYALLHCNSATHPIRETMNSLEANLDQELFVRIHRSAIVNLDRIKELKPLFRGDYRVLLDDGTELTLTKNYRARLDNHLLSGSFTR